MPDETLAAWALIIGGSAMTFATRAVFILPGARLRLSPALEGVLRYAPAAALMAIIVPEMLLVSGSISFSLENPRLVGGLAGFAIAAATRDMVLPIAGGMLALTLARLYA
jgi:branched-subunit amino acid transport protein